MYMRDGLKLAAAKLKVRPVRTSVVIVVVALLFTGISLVAFVFSGIVYSLRGFSNEGLSGRFIVQARPIIDTSFQYKDKAFLDDMLGRTASIVAEKKAAAKKLNISYDPANDMTLPTAKGGPGGANDDSVNSMSPLVQTAVHEHYAGLKGVQYTDFQSLAGRFGARQMYKSTYFGMDSGPPLAFGQYFSPIQDGKEQYAKLGDQGSLSTGFDTLLSNGWSYFDEDLLRPFVLSGQHLALGKDGSIPVIVPMSVAEQILGREKLLATASSAERLNHLVRMRRDAAGKTTQFCYRNQMSSDLLQQAREQIRSIEANRNKKDYVAPSLQYALPTEACGAVTISKDVRTAEEKNSAENELTFKRTYENYEEPMQQVTTLRIVGLVPDMNYEYGMSVRALAASVLQSSLGSGWYSPIKTVQAGSAASRVSRSYDESDVTNRAYYAEFNSLKDAREFIKSNTCTVKLDLMSSQIGNAGRSKSCATEGKYFDLKPFGSNASAIEDLRQNTWRVMKYVIAIVVLLTSLVLMGIVGKIIADSRRETAVFRALGASRGNIAHIYVAYTLFLSIGVIVAALGLGALASLWLSHKYSQDISTSAVLAYNAADVHKRFALFGVEPLLVLGIAGIVLVASLISAAVPLAANLQRNPIRDMRDEN